MTAPARVYYVYNKTCKYCGTAFESIRHDAIQCKRCKWRRRQAAYCARYPGRAAVYKKRWDVKHPDVRRAHKRASYWRDPEKARERNRQFRAQQKVKAPWQLDLARQIQQIAII